MWGGRGNPKTEAGAGPKEIRATKYAEGKNPERDEGNNLVFFRFMSFVLFGVSHAEKSERR